MSLRVMSDGNNAILWCDTSDWAFGPVFYGDDAGERAEAFIEFCDEDPRKYSEKELEGWFHEWLVQEEACAYCSSVTNGKKFCCKECQELFELRNP